MVFSCFFFTILFSVVSYKVDMWSSTDVEQHMYFEVSHMSRAMGRKELGRVWFSATL